MVRRTRYTPAPEVPAEQMRRVAAIVEVLAGIASVSEAARALGLARNHFQTILHRGVEGLVAAIETRPSGRSAKPKPEVALEQQVKRLQRENAKLKRRVDATEKLLTVAGGLLQGRIRPRRRSSKTGRRDDGADSEPESARTLAGLDAMRALGVSATVAATVAGVHPATVRRWRARRATAPCCVPQPRTKVVPEAARQAAGLVRALKGLVGAAALCHSVAGLSRRQAAEIKAQELTKMERERKTALTRMVVTEPGVLRGMDGVHYRDTDGPLWALVAADGAVPYRTSITLGRHYDAALVAQALELDIAHHGAPIVYRLDRAKAHESPAARAVLDAHQVLVMHGPPCCPRFYGQLERQNREHRAWADDLLALGDEDAGACLAAMLMGVNGLWRRRMLGWRTASEAWGSRSPLDIDRQALREEVEERTARIAQSLKGRGKPADMAERLAIEQVLQVRGYLRREPRGWC